MTEILQLYHICQWLHKYQLVEEFYSAIQRPDAYVRITTGFAGWSWEDYLKRRCEDKNIKYEEPENQGLPWDLKINDQHMQCKSTTYTKRVDIRSKKKENKRRYLLSDFDVLALRILTLKGNSYYFIPSIELVERENILRAGFRLEEYKRFEKKSVDDSLKALDRA